MLSDIEPKMADIYCPSDIGDKLLENQRFISLFYKAIMTKFRPLQEDVDNLTDCLCNILTSEKKELNPGLLLGLNNFFNRFLSKAYPLGIIVSSIEKKQIELSSEMQNFVNNLNCKIGSILAIEMGQLYSSMNNNSGAFDYIILSIPPDVDVSDPSMSSVNFLWNSVPSKEDRAEIRRTIEGKKATDSIITALINDDASYLEGLHSIPFCVGPATRIILEFYSLTEDMDPLVAAAILDSTRCFLFLAKYRSICDNLAIITSAALANCNFTILNLVYTKHCISSNYFTQAFCSLRPDIISWFFEHCNNRYRLNGFNIESNYIQCVLSPEAYFLFLSEQIEGKYPIFSNFYAYETTSTVLLLSDYRKVQLIQGTGIGIRSAAAFLCSIITSMKDNNAAYSFLQKLNFVSEALKVMFSMDTKMGLRAFRHIIKNSINIRAKTISDIISDCPIEVIRQYFQPIYYYVSTIPIELMRPLTEKIGNSIVWGYSLHYAAARGNEDIASLVLNLKWIDNNERDAFGIRPIEYSKNGKIAKMIYERGGRYGTSTSRGMKNSDFRRQTVDCAEQFENLKGPLHLKWQKDLEFIFGTPATNRPNLGQWERCDFCPARMNYISAIAFDNKR